MLPQANQARKALWDAVNPATGKRRIDEAFPHELRETTRDNEMMIRFRCGSTYQVVGSDNYESLIGSPPAGIVLSEWAKAKPQAWAMLSPILAENGGWALFIYTPRGRNHGHRLLETARREPGWFSEVLSAEDTDVLPSAILEGQRRELQDLYGPDFGDAIYRQEYLCDFNAPLLGAIYAQELTRLDREGRACAVPFDPEFPVYTAWDLGYGDATAIWFYQVITGEIRLLEYCEANLKGVDYYAGQILGRNVKLDIIDNELVCQLGAPIPEIAHRMQYRYAMHWLPHDAKAKTMAAKGKSIVEQLAKALGGFERLGIVPNLDKLDGIQAARMIFHRCYFDADGCEDGLEALRNYQRKWNDDRKAFLDEPLHDWTSHGADAFRMLAVAWRQDAKPEQPKPGKTIQTITLDELWEYEQNRVEARL